MQKLLLLVGLCVLVAHSEARNLVCTFQSVPNLNTVNPNNFDMASDMDPDLCTHIIFKYVQPSVTTMQIPTTIQGPIQDHKDFTKAFPSATAKTLLQVDLTRTSSAIFAPSKRDDFIASVIDVVTAEEFDGVDILWSQSEVNTPDKIGFTALMQDLKHELVRRLLTASVSGEIPDIDNSYKVPELAEVVDFFNVMTGDLDRTSPAGTFPNAIAGMQKWAEEAPTAKLNMGIATYGYDTNVDANPRILPKSQVCTVQEGSNTVHVDSVATVDDKAEYVVTQEFGGAFVTSLELDDFDDVCQAGPFPVTHRIKNII